MSLNTCRHLTALAALVLLVGCQTEMKSPATLAVAKADVPLPHVAALNKASAPAVAAQPPTAPAKPSAEAADKKQSGPQVHTAFFRVDAKPTAMPHVLMSKADEAA